MVTTLAALTVFASTPCTVVVLAKVGAGVTVPEAEAIAQSASESLAARGLEVLAIADRKRAVPGDPRCLGELNDACVEQLAQALEPTKAKTFVALEVAGTSRNVAISLRAIDLRKKLALASTTFTRRKPIDDGAFRQANLDELTASINQSCSAAEPTVVAARVPKVVEVRDPTVVDPSLTPTDPQLVEKSGPAPKGAVFWTTAVVVAVLATTTAVLFTHNAVLRGELYRGSSVVDGVTIWGIPQSRANELQAIINPEFVAACITGGLTLVAGLVLLLTQ
jgi:hypothetical protein